MVDVGLDIIGYLSALGINSYRRYGNEIVASCPFKKNHLHGDRHPSFGINLETGLWLCRSCEEKGNMVQLAQKVLDITFMEARNLAIKYGEEQDPLKIIDRLSKTQKSNHQIAYFDTDKWCKNEPIAYWESRGIRYDTQKIYRLGIDEIENRAVVPHIVDGKCLGWQKRNLSGCFPKWQSSSGFPKGDTLFGVDQAENGGVVIIVEAPVSAIWLSQIGYKSVATFGAGTTYNQSLLVRKMFDSAIIWFDPDDAGVKGMKKLARNLRDFMEVYVVEDAIGDPNECSEEQVSEALSKLRKLSFLDL